jgi:DNA-binding beta-propeller fold protein YncE
MHPVESPVAPRFSPALAGLALACGALACLLWLAAASPAAAQNLVGTPIPVSGGLITNGLAVDATTNRVYVSVEDSCNASNNCGGIAIIDGNTNTASATHIHPPSGTPTTGCCVNYFGDLAVDPSIHRLFVNGAYRVNAIDTTTNLPAGSSPVFTCGLNCPISQLALNTANHRIFAPVTHCPCMQIVDGTTLNLIGGSTALLTSPPPSQNINGSGTASDSRNQHFYIGAGDQPNNDRVVVLNGNGTQTSGPPSTGGNGCSSIRYLAVNPNTQRVYAMANSSSGGACIGMLDGPSNTPVGSLLTLAADLGGGGPLVVDTETNRIYALVGGRTIAVIDGATNTLISSTASTSGTGANAIAINVGLRRLYVSNRDQGTVAVFAIGAGAGRGDINIDGIVDIRDYGIWRTFFGQTNSGNPADLDGNNIVDIRDYGVWRTFFGHTAPDD